MIVESMNWALAWPYYLGALVVGYLLGSIPFGLLITKAAGFGDVRSIGSGNIGRTVAEHAVDAGHEVTVSNSRGPASLADLVLERVALLDVEK